MNGSTESQLTRTKGNQMKKSEMQKVVDRVLRAIYPFPPEKRKRILTIVENYIDDDFEAPEPEDDGDEVTDDMEKTPEQLRAEAS